MYEDSYQVLGQDYLEHFGIKGMKWGVRRTPEELGHRQAVKTARSEKRKANIKKAAAVAKKYGPAVAGGIALSVLGGVGLKYALTSSVGKSAINFGAQTLSRVLNGSSVIGRQSVRTIPDISNPFTRKNPLSFGFAPGGSMYPSVNDPRAYGSGSGVSDILKQKAR